jgi:hypothetical protein
MISSCQRGYVSFHPVRFALGISDPLSIAWAETSDAHLVKHFHIKHMRLQFWVPADLACILLLSFVGILKRLGYLREAEAFALSLAQGGNHRHMAIGQRELGDIAHLQYLWHQQLQAPGAEGLFFIAGDYFVLDDNQAYEATLQPVAFEEVRGRYQAAIDADPNFIWAYYELGRLHRNAGRSLEAHALFQQAYDNGAGPISGILAFQIRYFATGDQHRLQMDRNAFYKSYQISDPARKWNAVKEVNLAPMSALVPAGHDIVQVWNETRLDIVYRSARRGQVADVKRSLHFPSISYGRFDNLRRMGRPFSLVDETWLLSDTIHFHWPNHKMFNTHILENDNEKAVVFLGGQKRFPRHQHVFEPVIILGGSDRHDYFHSIFEALGSLALIEKENFLPDRLIVLHYRAPPWLRELFLMLGVTNHFLIMEREGHDQRLTSEYIFHDAIQLACPSRMTIPHPLAVEFLNRRLRPAEATIKRGKYVHLARVGKRSLRAGKRQAFYEFLLSHGFEVVEPSSLSIAAQRDLLADAEIVSAEGGAALSNLIFCPEGCKVIMIAPTNHLYEVWSVVTKQLKQKLWVSLEEPAASYPNCYHLWSSLENKVDLATYRACFEEALASDGRRV